MNPGPTYMTRMIAGVALFVCVIGASGCETSGPASPEDPHSGRAFYGEWAGTLSRTDSLGHAYTDSLKLRIVEADPERLSLDYVSVCLYGRSVESGIVSFWHDESIDFRYVGDQGPAGQPSQRLAADAEGKLRGDSIAGSWVSLEIPIVPRHVVYWGTWVVKKK